MARYYFDNPAIQKFHTWATQILPTVYIDSLSYTELLYKLCNTVNALIDEVVKSEDEYEKLINDALNQIQDVVEKVENIEQNIDANIEEAVQRVTGNVIEQVNELKTGLTELQQTVETNKQAAEQANTETNNNLNQHIQEFTQYKTDNDGKVTQNTNDITQLKAKDSSLQDQINLLSGIVTGEQGSVEEVIERVQAVEDSQGQQDTKIEALESWKTTTDTTIQEIQAQQTTQDTNINNNQQAIEQAEQDITKLQTDLLQTNGNVANIEGDIQEIQEQQTTQDTNIQNNQQAITAQETKNTQQDTQITQNTNDIVKLKSSIENFTSGSNPNLFKNANFKYRPYTSLAINIKNSNLLSLCPCWYMANFPQNQSITSMIFNENTIGLQNINSRIRIYQYVPDIVNKEVTISMDYNQIYNESSFSPAIAIVNTDTFGRGDSVQNEYIISKQEIERTTKKGSITFTVTPQYEFIGIEITAPFNGSLTVSNIKMEYGKNATPFTPETYAEAKANSEQCFGYALDEGTLLYYDKANNTYLPALIKLPPNNMINNNLSVSQNIDLTVKLRSDINNQTLISGNYFETSSTIIPNTTTESTYLTGLSKSDILSYSTGHIIINLRSQSTTITSRTLTPNKGFFILQEYIGYYYYINGLIQNT